MVIIFFCYNGISFIHRNVQRPMHLTQVLYLIKSLYVQCVCVMIIMLILEIVFTRAAPAFDNLFMGCVFNINTVHKTVKKLTFQAFY